jgi:enamine deaminase RidA (YjgF/YER057c/UK114 family)
VPAEAQPPDHYATWQRAWDFIYLSGVVAVVPQASSIVRGFSDIPDEVTQRRHFD